MKKILLFGSIMLTAILTMTTSCVHHDLTPSGDCGVDSISLEVVSVVDADCVLPDGSVEVRASGGSGIYQFRIGSDPFQNEPFFTSLSAGTYNVTVADESGCTNTISVSVRNKSGINMNVTASDAGCGSNLGTIVAEPSGGTPPYVFSFNGAGFQENNSVDGLSTGDYTVITKDAAGCEVSQQIRIGTGIRFSSTVSSIIQNNCAISNCHNGTQPPDLRTFEQIKQHAANIRSQVVSRVMPQEGSLTQAQIDAIACWVDEGAPDN